MDPSMALRRATLEEVMTVLSIYVRGKYAESIAQRMLRVIGAKIHLRMDTLSDEQVEILRARAHEKQEGAHEMGVEVMFSRICSVK